MFQNTNSENTPATKPKQETGSKTVKLATPSNNSESSKLERNCNSTGGIIRKYRLSLNKNIRDKYTRKKLVFQEPAPPDDERNLADERSTFGIPKSHQELSCDENKPEDYSTLLLLPVPDQISELERQIAIKKQKLQNLQRYETENASIQADINTWEQGFRVALETLCTLRPNYTAEQILQQLGIPNDLVEY